MHEENSVKAEAVESSEQLLSPRPAPVRDPFFENVVKLPPRREVEAQLEKWKRRARAFQEAYKEKSFEAFALDIQLMDLRAYGVDVVTARNNKSLRDKLLSVCVERNEARERIKELTEALEKFGEHAPHCKSNERYPSSPCDCGLASAFIPAVVEAAKPRILPARDAGTEPDIPEGSLPPSPIDR